MKYDQDKTNSNKFLSSANNLTNKNIQKKTKALEDNRPASTVQKKANNTGLPDQLKSGIESLSGHSLDNVKVHYNSDKPAQLHAHAYAQGTNIHVASGQEKHLPHEAWHIVQQKQGRVKPTLQMKGKVNINDDKGLEKEADVMGAKAIAHSTSESSINTVQRKEKAVAHNSRCGCPSCSSQSTQLKSSSPVQRQKKDVVQLACKHGNVKSKCPHCQQSINARNANVVNSYQTPHKNAQVQQARVDAVKGKKGAIAHGSGNKSSGQSNKIKKILKGVND